jgi:predicted  nucleic acid-binding Zn-ribbon protein
MAEVEYKGIKVGGSKLLIILPLLGTLGSGLWGGFEFYKDYTSMKNIIKNINITAIKTENILVQTKLDSAIDYTRDIKNDLREDILKMEGYIDKIDGKVDRFIDKIKDTQDSIDLVLEGNLNEMNQLQKDTTSAIREVESLSRETEKDVRDTMRTTENRIEDDMRKLDERLSQRLQEALDNPLVGN